jgi:hypothetical protein
VLSVPERIERSAMVDKKQLDLCWICHEFQKMQYFQ